MGSSFFESLLFLIARRAIKSFGFMLSFSGHRKKPRLKQFVVKHTSPEREQIKKKPVRLLVASLGAHGREAAVHGHDLDDFLMEAFVLLSVVR